MTTAFVDGPVITGTGKILEHATVLVENDKIVKVANGDINIPPGATKIPLEGRTLLPGLIDSHIHICIDGSPDPVNTAFRESPTTTTLKAARFASQTLMAGMIFVPSRDGRSHCPQEFTRIEDIVLGCEILLDTVAELAA